MITAIRKNLRNFIAIVALFIFAGAISYYILQEQRLRIPILEEKPFQFSAEFDNAQGVVAGQGQTLRVAGVRVGDVSKVELVDGRAVVTFDVDRDSLPIYENATILMRPLTGLRDMFFSLDPGSRDAEGGEIEEGDELPLTNTAPDVPLDLILEALDNDNQAYLRSILIGAGKGLEGRGRDLGRILGSLGPINRDLERLNTEVAKRDENLSSLVHNLSTLTGSIGKQDEDIMRLVTESNDTLGAIAQEEPDVQSAVSQLPGALSQTREALVAVDDLGAALGPAFEDLRPFARNLPELNSSTRELAETVTPVIRDEIRPLVRAAREPIPDIRRGAAKLSKTAPGLTTIGRKLNVLGNMAAYNPRGAEECTATSCPPGRDEGYLYWAGWLGHNSVSVFQAQDANGLYRRIYFTAGCEELLNILTGSPGGPAIAGLVTGLGPLFAPGGACD
ncbi:MAG: MlaD family protein [Actinomycetota bacterium]|nr:MlaD family protein [Actinomycetota bacterium]